MRRLWFCRAQAAVPLQPCLGGCFGDPIKECTCSSARSAATGDAFPACCSMASISTSRYTGCDTRGWPKGARQEPCVARPEQVEGILLRDSRKAGCRAASSREALADSSNILPRTAPVSSACLCGRATRDRMRYEACGQCERGLSLVNTTIEGAVLVQKGAGVWP